MVGSAECNCRAWTCPLSWSNGSEDWRGVTHGVAVFKKSANADLGFSKIIWGVPKMGFSQEIQEYIVYFMENPIEMDDSEVPF